MKKTEGSVLAARAAANVGSRYANARSLLLSMGSLLQASEPSSK